MKTVIAKTGRTGILGVACAAVCAGTVMAQAPTPPLGASPLPKDGEYRFCYYRGLAYSAGAMITVNVPIRREVVSDRPTKAFRCVSGHTEPARFFWEEVDPDEGDPFRN